MSFSHTRHLLATQIVRWPRRVGRVQLDQPLADCRQPDGASSRLYEPGYIVLEEERTDSGPGIDRTGLLWYIVEGGARKGQGLTAQGLGTHPGWLAHVRGATWCGKNSLGHMIHPLGIATYSRATVQSYPSGAHSSLPTMILEYFYFFRWLEYLYLFRWCWLYWCIVLPVYFIYIFTWLILLQVQFSDLCLCFHSLCIAWYIMVFSFLPQL